MPMNIPPTEYDPRFVQGVRYFNAGAFFEAHEVWEDVWRECADASRPFYQGLIQVAVCLHHFGNRNTRGARKLCLSASNYLQPFSPRFGGLCVRQLLADLQACCAEILADPNPRPRAVLDPARIPRLSLDPPPRDERQAVVDREPSG